MGIKIQGIEKFVISTSLPLTDPFQRLSKLALAIFDNQVGKLIILLIFFIPDALRIELRTLMFVKQLPRMIMSGSCLKRASTNFVEFSCEES